jgi:hypothetical protein
VTEGRSAIEAVMETTSTSYAASLNEIQKAAQTIASYAHVTPVTLHEHSPLVLTQRDGWKQETSSSSYHIVLISIELSNV